MTNKSLLLPALAFVTGMGLFGTILSSAILKTRSPVVTVKGLSEREVPADLTIWPLRFSVNDNDLSGLQRQIEASRETVRAFLRAEGFQDAEISTPPSQISDFSLVPVDDEKAKRPFRYSARVTVLLRSINVAAVKTALERCDRLVTQGIVISGGEYMSGPQFLFTGLNAIKPDMIREATRNARLAAEKFAADSESPVGRIRHAHQGPFEVYDVDPSSPERKIVRVVTTVDFELD